MRKCTSRRTESEEILELGPSLFFRTVIEDDTENNRLVGI